MWEMDTGGSSSELTKSGEGHDGSSKWGQFTSSLDSTIYDLENNGKASNGSTDYPVARLTTVLFCSVRVQAV